MRPSSQTDADRAWPVLSPVFRKARGVRERKPRASGSIVRETYLHPTDVLAELPCEREIPMVVRTP